MEEFLVMYTSDACQGCQKIVNTEIFAALAQCLFKNNVNIDKIRVTLPVEVDRGEKQLKLHPHHISILDPTGSMVPIKLPLFIVEKRLDEWDPNIKRPIRLVSKKIEDFWTFSTLLKQQLEENGMIQYITPYGVEPNFLIDMYVNYILSELDSINI